MWREDTVRVAIDVAVVAFSIVFIMALLCWMNNLPRKLYQVAQSWRHAIFRYQSSPTPESSNPSPHPPTSDLDEIPILEPMDDVQLFLAELRLSSMTQPTLNISNVARYEFISNLLITEKFKTTALSSSSTCGYQGMSCAICLGEYQPCDIICSSHNSNCNHRFHQACIFRWLLQNRDDCPCCRNNYLALSDDESVVPPDSSSTSSTEFSEVVEEDGNPGRNSPSSNHVAEMAWIPSYLAPLPPPRPTGRESQVDNNEEPSSGPIAQSSSSSSSSGLLLLPNPLPQTEESLTGNDETNGSLSDDLDQIDPEVWSCPSVDDTDQETWNTVYALRNKMWIPNRTTIRRSVVSQPRHHASDEQTQSLQLDDLIVEGLMQRLQARTEGFHMSASSSSSASSGSLYTEGSTDLDVSMPTRSLVVGHVAREECEMCAICRAEYAVNEELCWSQDPSCTHVFHRCCMQQWIMEGHDFCPFCRAHSNDPNPQPSHSNPTIVDDSETFPDRQHYPMVSSFVEAARGDKVTPESSQPNDIDSSAGTETSFLDTDLDIWADV